jgi:hypothetical protein
VFVLLDSFRPKSWSPLIQFTIGTEVTIGAGIPFGLRPAFIELGTANVPLADSRPGI